MREVWGIVHGGFAWYGVLGLALVDECGRLSAARPYLHRFLSFNMGFTWVNGLAEFIFHFSGVRPGPGLQEKDRATGEGEPRLQEQRDQASTFSEPKHNFTDMEREIWIKMS